MNTNAPSTPASALLSPTPDTSSSLTESVPPAPQGVGRPGTFSVTMVEVLCGVARQTGVSDSGAAGRASLHPSTVARWKRDFPDFAILLRSAREELRAAQLGLILEAARSGQPGGWKAAAWVLERTFPQDYAPGAQQRAQFQEQFDATWAAEGEGNALASPDSPALLPAPSPAAPTDSPRVEALQNVQNSKAAARPSSTPSTHPEGAPLQNLQNPQPRLAHAASGFEVESAAALP